MRIVFFGSASFGIPCLKAMQESPHELVHMFTQPAKPTGRGKRVQTTDVAQWAIQNNVPVTETSHVNQMIDQIRACGGELLVVIAFGQKISQEIIGIFPKGAINVHSSLLPKLRGAAPINWAIINGEQESGISIITLADRMDAGFVLGQVSTPIHDSDNASTLHDRLAALAAPLLIDTIHRIEAGTVEYRPQDESQVTLAPKFKKSDGLLDFSKSAKELFHQIRGMYPWPGAQATLYTQENDKMHPLVIAASEILEADGSASVPGTLDENLHVNCGAGKLCILELKPAGKSTMSFDAFVHGRHVKPGDRFLLPEEVQK